MYASVKLQFTNEKSPLDEIRPSVKLQVTYEKSPFDEIRPSVKWKRPL